MDKNMISRPHPFQYDLYTEPVGIIPRQEYIINKNSIILNEPWSKSKQTFSLIVPNIKLIWTQWNKQLNNDLKLVKNN